MTELRILLADDHEVVRAGLRALLDATPGVRVVGEAANGAEAVEQAQALRPDVVVMDVSMPVLDGAAATERLCRAVPGARVLALTAHGDRANVLRLLQAGAAGYVLKHAATDELVRAIRAVASGASYVDPSVAGGALSDGPAQAGAPGAGAALSEREEEVLRRIAWGEGNKEVAMALGISARTVETYRARIADKLGLKTRTDMVRYAVRRGWLNEG